MIGNGAGGMSPGAADAKYLKLTGGALSGALAMGNNKITGLATPTANTDAATKEYVDGSALFTDIYKSVGAGNKIKIASHFEETACVTVTATQNNFYVTGIRNADGIYFSPVVLYSDGQYWTIDSGNNKRFVLVFHVSSAEIEYVKTATNKLLGSSITIIT